MHPEKKAAAKDVLKKLICMAQKMMMDGMGDDEHAGSKLTDAMHEEGSPMEEAHEPKAEAVAEGDDEQSFADYKQSEMKRSARRSPLKTRSSAIMVATKGPKGRGKY